MSDLWADLEAASREPGPTMTITKAQYAALLSAVSVPQARAFDGCCDKRLGNGCTCPCHAVSVPTPLDAPLHLRGVTPRRSFDLRQPEDFRWLADYFAGYHGVAGLRAALAAPQQEYAKGYDHGWRDALAAPQPVPEDVGTCDGYHYGDVECSWCRKYRPAIYAAPTDYRRAIETEEVQPADVDGEVDHEWPVPEEPDLSPAAGQPLNPDQVLPDA